MALFAAAAAIGAAFSNGAPTGTAAWDIVLKAAAGALFVAAVANAPHTVAIVVATVATALIGTSAWLAAPALGLQLAITYGFVASRYRWIKPASAALTVQGLLRFPAFGFFGLPSLIAGAAIALALIFGYRRAGDRTRRIALVTAGVTVSAVAVICLVGGLVLLGARSDVERGISAARGGLSAARGGDAPAVVERLEVAAQSLADAERRSTSLLAQPLRLIPIAAQHREAITVATREGSLVAGQASRATIEADISSIRMSVGSVDLSALSAMEAELVRTAELLETAVQELDAARSPWLLSPLATRMELLTDEMRAVVPEAQIAAEAARVVPGLLGQDGPRRYFVAFGTPAESRELGGLLGSWALLEFDGGSVRQIEAGRVAALYDLTRSKEPLRRPDFPAWFVDRAQPGMFPQNMTRSPRLSVVAAAARELVDGIGGGPIDGFVYVDGYALGDMLELTGPIRIEGVDGPINADNADKFFFDQQYRLVERDELKAELNEVFGAVFEGLLDSQLPGPERLGRVLGPAARQGRLQVATFDDEENAFLRSVRLQREFGPSAVTVDSVAVVQSNASVSKLDLYLHRDVTYDVAVDGDGRLTGLVRVDLSSRIPPDAPQYALGSDSPGVNTVQLSLYSPHALLAVRLDGEPVDFRFVEELGYGRYEVSVQLPPNSSRVVEYDLTGLVDPAGLYDLSIWHQPLVNNDTMHVRYRPTGQAATASDFELVEDTVYRADG